MTMNIQTCLREEDLPANLRDVVQRLRYGQAVHGFELHLLAEYVGG